MAHGLPDYTFLPSPVQVASARVYNSTDLTLTSGIDYSLTFDSEVFNYQAMHSLSSNTDRLTAPVAGLYLVVFIADVQSLKAPELIARIIAGVGTTIARQVLEPGTFQNVVPTLSTLWRMNQGDYVTAHLAQASGQDAVSKAQSVYSPQFAATWLSP